MSARASQASMYSPSLGGPMPKFSVCMIVLNEAEYLEANLTQIYGWEACHEVIIVEGAVALYPELSLGRGRLSGDGTTEIIKNFPDPLGKIKYISGHFSNKVAQRNEYAKRVTGTHALVLDADEFYCMKDLDCIARDARDHPECERFTFDFSQDLNRRNYFHLWFSFTEHVVGGYWNVPHNRIYKWTPGTRYLGSDHNHPVKPDGRRLTQGSVPSRRSSASCVHVGFVKSRKNQKEKNDFYVNRGEGREREPKLRARRQMYIDCRRAYETWVPGETLPHNAQILPFSNQLPESLVQHPYFHASKTVA